MDKPEPEHPAPVLIERRGRVGIVTLNRPEARNAINAEVAAALVDAFDELEADDDIWVHVITGSGDIAFCAGADLKEMAQTAHGSPVRRPSVAARGGFAGITARQFVKPLIAAVNGAALGGGTEICLACDLIVADEHAMFGLPEPRRGIAAGGGGLQRLPRRIPPGIAMELILTGLPISAVRAADLGLVNSVVSKGLCLSEAIRLADAICEAAPLSVRFSKAVARSSFSMAEDEAILVHTHLYDALLLSDDAHEGPRAFAEKRVPQWKAK